MISVCFQGKPVNITVIQVYAPTTDLKGAEVDWFYEDLQHLLELTREKDVLFITGIGLQKLCVKIHLFFFFFAIGCPCVLATFVKKTILAPLYYLWSFVKDQLTLFKWVCFWALHSVLLIYLSVLSPIAHCLDYCSFIVSLMVIQICSSLILCWLFWVFASLYKLVDIHKISWGDFENVWRRTGKFF